MFGATDPKAGALGTLYNLGADPRLNHDVAVTAGVLFEALPARVDGTPVADGRAGWRSDSARSTTTRRRHGRTSTAANWG